MEDSYRKFLISQGIDPDSLENKKDESGDNSNDKKLSPVEKQVVDIVLKIIYLETIFLFCLDFFIWCNKIKQNRIMDRKFTLPFRNAGTGVAADLLYTGLRSISSKEPKIRNQDFLR